MPLEVIFLVICLLGKLPVNARGRRQMITVLTVCLCDGNKYSDLNFQAIKTEELVNLSPSTPVLLICYGPWQGRGPVVRGVEHIQR